MQTKAAFFDLFGTLLLLGSEKVYYTPCLKRLYDFLVEAGVDVPFEVFSRVFFEVRKEIHIQSRRTLKEPHFKVRVAQTLQRLGYNFSVSDPVVVGATMAFADELTNHTSLDADAPVVLERLHERYKLGLISNFGIPECAWRLLERFRLKGFFDVVIISAEVNRRKPSPEIFEMGLKALGVEASKAVFVGDRLDLDVAGPRSVGMRTILIKRSPLEQDVCVSPDGIITGLEELPTALEDLQSHGER